MKKKLMLVGIIVFTVFKNSPASEAGLKFNDIILEVNGTSVKGMTTTKVVSLIKDEKNNTSYITTKEKGKLSTLTYQVVKTVDNLNLVKINLLTGRHHQIRVQFSSRNNPLYGDHKYNPFVKSNDKSNIALIAKTLSFYHPTTLKLLTFDIDLPKKYPWNLF